MIYVDESIQQELGYICTALLYVDRSLDTLIEKELIAAGMQPGVDEYKSSARMAGRADLHKLRLGLGTIVQLNCRLAVLVCPSDDRTNLGRYLIETLDRMISVNALPIDQEIFIDDGIHIPRGRALDALISRGVQLTPNVDSRAVLGVQLADYAAYHCSYIIREHLLAYPKYESLGVDAGYDEEISAELGWILRVQLRHALFREELQSTVLPENWDFTHQLFGYGIFICGSLDSEVESAVRSQFERIYMGCVH